MKSTNYYKNSAFLKWGVLFFFMEFSLLESSAYTAFNRVAYLVPSYV